MDVYNSKKPMVDIDRLTSHHNHTPLYPTPTGIGGRGAATTSDVGILKSTLLPSFSLHTGFSIAAFVAAKITDRAELKDWAWPSSQVANAWWSAVGHRMCNDNLSLCTAFRTIPWTEKVLLSSVSLWGTRLFYRIVSRSVSRGRDDPRYDELKAQNPKGFWKSAFVKLYLPEAAFLTVITLPFTLPFQLGAGASSLDLSAEAAETVRALGVALFSAGFALETMADVQLELHRQERTDLCRHGVWSIVRHPNYLGDTLVHISFAVLNMANSFHPLALLGPVANYFFLRLVGGDKQNEASQEVRYKEQDAHKYAQLETWRREKNSFWPGFVEVANPWTWVVLGSGLVGVVIEEGMRGWVSQ